MPFIASWPARIKPRSVCAETISHVDLLATFAALVEKKLPDGAGEDSFNLLPLLLGRTAHSNRASTVALSSGGVLSIRQGDWKLIPALGSRGMSEPRVIKAEAGGPEGQLYNLATDPSEQQNLYPRHPEIVVRLTTLLEECKRKGRSRIPE